LNFTGTLTGKSVTINSTGITNASFLDDVTIMGNLNLTTGAQDDTFKLAVPLFVSNSVTVNTGGGDDTVDWKAPGATVLGNMTIRTGDGADTVNLTHFTVGAAANIDLGSLDDSLSIDDSTFFGSVLINAGSGSDQVRIEQADTGVASTFKGAVAVRLGSGDDVLTIGRDGDLNDRGVFSQRVTIDGGPGLDVANVLPTTDGGTRSNDFAFFPTFLGVEATA
jgi:fibronectin-binding autotransporter adhesin